VGQHIRVAVELGAHDATPAPWLTVVGVVADVRKTLTEENPPDLYMSLAQSPPMIASLVVRDPSGRARVNAIREAVWSVNAELPLDEVRWLEDDVAFATLPSRFLATLLSGFAAFAVLLATVGLYGVIAYAVLQQRRDIAIRMAVGATRGHVIRMFLGRGAVLVGAGLAAGLAGGLALSRLMRGVLFGVSPTDALTYAVVALLLGAAALLATWLPARRAAHAEPMQVLQSG
jgi:cell division protein FtsX